VADAAAGRTAVSAARAERWPDGRWHFQHGPIDCILHADGDAGAVERALGAAWSRFGGVLVELVGELALLRTDLASPQGATLTPRGPIARRMVAACRPYAEGGRFITAMAAVAGSVAEELLECFAAEPGVQRAYVNDGGDIALHLTEGAEPYTVGLVADAGRAVRARLRGAAAPALDGAIRIDARCGVRGIATSGWRGRSFSLGIADAATVLAASASQADAAATVVGNAVVVDDPRIARRPASELRDDSDLGDRLVTVAVPLLEAEQVRCALDRGAAAARAGIAAGRIVAAALALQGSIRLCPETIAFDTLGAAGRARFERPSASA
jgi:ApbE superfamily uncharacterized protein (UPF0280 family)